MSVRQSVFKTHATERNRPCFAMHRINGRRKNRIYKSPFQAVPFSEGPLRLPTYLKREVAHPPSNSCFSLNTTQVNDCSILSILQVNHSAYYLKHELLWEIFFTQRLLQVNQFVA